MELGKFRDVCTCWPSACLTPLALQGPGEGHFLGVVFLVSQSSSSSPVLSLTALCNCELIYTQHCSFIVIHLRFHGTIKLPFLSSMFPKSSKATAGILIFVDQLKTGSHFFPNLVWRPTKPMTRCGSFQNVQFTQKSTEIELILNH